MDDTENKDIRPCECGHYLFPIDSVRHWWWCGACGRMMAEEEDGGTSWFEPNHELEGVSWEMQREEEYRIFAENDGVARKRDHMTRSEELARMSEDDKEQDILKQLSEHGCIRIDRKPAMAFWREAVRRLKDAERVETRFVENCEAQYSYLEITPGACFARKACSCRCQQTD